MALETNLVDLIAQQGANLTFDIEVFEDSVPVPGAQFDAVYCQIRRVQDPPDTDVPVADCELGGGGGISVSVDGVVTVDFSHTKTALLKPNVPYFYDVLMVRTTGTRYRIQQGKVIVDPRVTLEPEV